MINAVLFAGAGSWTSRGLLRCFFLAARPHPSSNWDWRLFWAIFQYFLASRTVSDLIPRGGVCSEQRRVRCLVPLHRRGSVDALALLSSGKGQPCSETPQEQRLQSWCWRVAYTRAGRTLWPLSLLVIAAREPPISYRGWSKAEHHGTQENLPSPFNLFWVCNQNNG